MDTVVNEVERVMDLEGPGSVLVVDDSPVVRAMIGGQLRDAGYSVDLAEDGAKAIALLERKAFHVVITDIRMPGVDGFGVLEAVKRQEREPEVIILTGAHKEDIGSAIRALQLGAHDFLTKPLSRPDQAVQSVAAAFEKRRQREALRAAEARQLFERIPIGLYRTTPEGQFLDANPALVQMLGFPDRRTLLATNATDLHPDPEDRRRRQERLEREGVLDRFEKRLRRPDGTVLWVEENARPVRDAQGRVRCYEGSLQDVTERRHLEANLLRAQRMEGIGSLAGGIAHDLNNVLSPIVMGVEILKRKVTDPQGQRLLSTLERSAARGTDLVKQVLTFARGAEGEKVVLQPARLIREMEDIIRQTFPKSIDARVVMPRDLWTVSAQPTPLHQVLLNLCVNARDAMPGGGNLSLTAENVILDQSAKRRHPDAGAGRYVLVTVADSGTGIPPEIMDRIFDPFFTTKEVGKGTGLGLSTTLSIVKSLGGFIEVESWPMTGAAFKIYLPASAGPEAASDVPEAEPPAAASGELILVVEDEPSIREIARETLEAHGYRVITADDGVQAVDIYVERHAEIDLVLTDVSMPHLDGPGLSRILHQSNPKVRVVASSGNAGNRPIAEASGAEAFMSKPYTAHTLVSTVRTVLASAAP